MKSGRALPRAADAGPSLAPQLERSASSRSLQWEGDEFWHEGDDVENLGTAAGGARPSAPQEDGAPWALPALGAAPSGTGEDGTGEDGTGEDGSGEDGSGVTVECTVQVVPEKPSAQ